MGEEGRRPLCFMQLTHLSGETLISSEDIVYAKACLALT